MSYQRYELELVKRYGSSPLISVVFFSIFAERLWHSLIWSCELGGTQFNRGSRLVGAEARRSMAKTDSCAILNGSPQCYKFPSSYCQSSGASYWRGKKDLFWRRKYGFRNVDENKHFPLKYFPLKCRSKETTTTVTARIHIHSRAKWLRTETDSRHFHEDYRFE